MSNSSEQSLVAGMERILEVKEIELSEAKSGVMASVALVAKAI